MITLDWDQLIFSFPEVHPKAKLGIYFERTLRTPQGEKDFVLPALLGDFPVRRVDDYSEAIPKHWRRHGGVMLPMYQSEAMWSPLGNVGSMACTWRMKSSSSSLQRH